MILDNVNVLGFKGEISSVSDTLNYINKIKEDGEIIQLLNADAVACKNHVFHGVNQAILAFERGENLANDLSVEIVLRCSAQRQISKAFDILGLREGKINLCAVLVNCRKDYCDELSEIFTLDDSVFKQNTEKLCEIYNIENQIFPVEDLIIDKITRLTVDY